MWGCEGFPPKEWGMFEGVGVIRYIMANLTPDLEMMMRQKTKIRGLNGRAQALASLLWTGK